MKFVKCSNYKREEDEDEDGDGTGLRERYDEGLRSRRIKGFQSQPFGTIGNMQRNG